MEKAYTEIFKRCGLDFRESLVMVAQWVVKIQKNSWRSQKIGEVRSVTQQKAIMPLT